METSADGCPISRITIGCMPTEHEALVDRLKDLAEVSGETDPDDEANALLYSWLEDVDDLLYFDGPIYDENIIITLGGLSFKLQSLISSGAKLKVVERSVISVPEGYNLAYTNMKGDGFLEWLSICGDKEALNPLCEVDSDDDPGKFGSDLEILVKQWDTPIGELTMFVGIAFRSNGSYEWNEDWGDGSYESDVDSQEAELLVGDSNSFKPMDQASIDDLINEVCSKCE